MELGIPAPTLGITQVHPQQVAREQGRLLAALARGALALELAQAEADAAPHLVGVEHHHLDLVADLEDVLGSFDVIPRQLADMEQALDAVGAPQDCTVPLGLGDDAGRGVVVFRAVGAVADHPVNIAPPRP